MARNSYPGWCYKCGLWVLAGEGHFERVKGSKPGHIPGGWKVQHANCAKKKKPPVDHMGEQQDALNGD